jgi:predicted transcriptional regulator
MIEIKIKLWGDTLHALEMLAEGTDRTPEQLASEIVENYHEAWMSDNGTKSLTCQRTPEAN